LRFSAAASSSASIKFITRWFSIARWFPERTSLRADANQVAKRARPRLPGHPTAMSNENPKPDDESIDENRPI